MHRAAPEKGTQETGTGEVLHLREVIVGGFAVLPLFLDKSGALQDVIVPFILAATPVRDWACLPL